MKSLEFRNYRQTPNDQYMLGIAEIRLGLADGGKVVLRYKHVKTKDGTGTFFTPATYSQEENGVKKYIPCFMFDSRSDDEEVLEFVRNSVNTFIHGKARPQENSSSPQWNPNPYLMQQGSAQQPNSMKEVVEEQPLPF